MFSNRPLVGPAVAFAIGVGIGVAGRLSFAGFGAAAGIISFGLAFGAVLGRHHRLARIFTILAFLGCGLFSGASSERPTRNPLVDAAAVAGESVDLEAMVVRPALRKADGAHLLLRALVAARVVSGAQPVFSPASFLATVVLHGKELAWNGVAVPGTGDRIRLRTKLQPPRQPQNPGEPDFAARAAREGIAYTGSADLAAVSVLSFGDGAPTLFERWRRSFVDRTEAVCTTNDRAALVSALAAGERSAISADVTEDFNAAGLAHLLCISGLHLAVAVLLFYRLLAWLLSRSTWLALRIVPARMAAAITLPLTALYVAFIGAPLPTLRAGVGAAFFLGGALLGRMPDGLNALAAAALTILALDPPALFDPSFQLSFAAMLGVFLLVPPLRDLLPFARLENAPDRSWQGRARSLLERLLGMATICVAVSLATAPFTAMIFHRASLISVVANLVSYLPGAGLVPVSASAMIVNAFSETLALPLFWLADLGAGALLACAHAFGDLTFSQVRVAAPSLPTMLFWYAMVLGFTHVRRWPHRALWLGLAGAAGLVITLSTQMIARRFSRDLVVTFLSVGQGDAAVVEFPGGGAMLIDGGGQQGGTFDPGEKIVTPFLWERGIHRLDTIVATHPHGDHVLGLFAVLDHFSVGELWHNGADDSMGLAAKLRDHATVRGVPLRLIGPSYNAIHGEIGIQALRANDDGTLTENEQSIALRLRYDNVALLLAGDLEAEAERRILDTGAPLAAALVKAPHHGSRTSSTAAFIRTVAPHHVVFCIGAHNKFGFPHAEVLARYEAAGCKLWRTDEGAVEARTDGRTLVVRRAVVH